MRSPLKTSYAWISELSKKEYSHPENFPTRGSVSRHRKNAVTLKTSHAWISESSQKECGHPENFLRVDQRVVTEGMRSP